VDPHRYRRLRQPGFDDLTMSLAFLPDLKTESTALPACRTSINKAGYRGKAIPGYTPRDYLTHWLSQWVRDYGIDGFRVDTAKHVEQAAWQQLKTQATAALAEWKKPIRIKRWITRRSG
jgi:alpha-amylase